MSLQSKALEKIKPKGHLCLVSYELSISKMILEKVQNDFTGIESLEHLKKNKHIIKYIMKLIDVALNDRKIFTDRSVIKQLDKSRICVNVCKLLLNLKPQDEESILSDIEFIVDEIMKKKGFLKKVLRFVSRLLK
jgi:hypothetical protein